MGEGIGLIDYKFEVPGKGGYTGRVACLAGTITRHLDDTSLDFPPAWTRDEFKNQLKRQCDRAGQLIRVNGLFMGELVGSPDAHSAQVVTAATSAIFNRLLLPSGDVSLARMYPTILQPSFPIDFGISTGVEQRHGEKRVRLDHIGADALDFIVTGRIGLGEALEHARHMIERGTPTRIALAEVQKKISAIVKGLKETESYPVDYALLLLDYIRGALGVYELNLSRK